MQKNLSWLPIVATIVGTMFGAGICFYKAWLIYAVGGDADIAGSLCFVAGLILGAGIINVVRALHHPLP